MFRGLNFKVFSLGLLGIIGLLVVGGIYFVGNNLQTKQVELANGANAYAGKALQVDNALLSARRAEKDFLLRGELKYSERHAEIGKEVNATLLDIQKVAVNAGAIEVADQTGVLITAYLAYEELFKQLVASKTELGLTPEEGLEGSLRKSVHAIEAKLGEFNDPRLTSAMLMLRRHEKDLMLRHDAKYVEKHGAAADDFSKTLAASTLPADATREVETLLANYQRDFKAWAEKDNQSAELVAAMSNAYAEMDPVADFIVTNIQAIAASAVKAEQTISSMTRMIILISIASAALIVMALSWLVGRAIVVPLGKMTSSMSQLADGNLEVEIVGTERRDEIGSMARALEVFKANAIANKKLELEAEESRKRNEAERIALQEQAEADAAERLRVATAGLATGLKRLASGDLSFQLTEAFAPDFEALRMDFNQSVGQLGSTMSAIASTVTVMDSGTREIAAGADDLSRRTEQQAASLEETAAAVEEITSNVANSTKRTEEARGVAKRANESAVKSAEVVSHAEEAMREIESSSQQISNIIGVIDEIAFQTNLLALNAGVEAARAGEAGKGFAVVAQEVRELAQRAAGAAKEIKSLIENSSSQVENGVKLVRDTSDALNAIGEFIVEMNGHMESIATSAIEQSTGLKEVNQAVNAMDQTTQQNAAMVEQSNAASNSLAQEAAKLRDLVSQFRLEGIASSQSAALRKTAETMARPAQQVEAAAPKPMRAKVAAAGSTSSQGWEEF